MGEILGSLSSENIDLIRRLYERWKQRDLGREFFDPDVEHVRIGADAAGMSGAWKGIDEMWKATAEWLQAWENLRAEPKQYIDRGDQVLAIIRTKGRGRRSGIELDQEHGQLFTIRDGKIVRWVSYWDVSDALQAVGLQGET